MTAINEDVLAKEKVTTELESVEKSEQISYNDMTKKKQQMKV
nr:hypothetical protein [Wolbachia endosymbiont of Atemnus politus]